MKQFKAGNPILFRTPYWVSLPSDEEVKFKLKPLPYWLVKEMEYNAYAQTNNYLTNEEILLQAIVETFNVEGFNSIESLLNQLHKSDKEFLVKKVLDNSSITAEQYSELEAMINIVLDPKLQNDNWDCDTCIHKKLQAHRACGFTDPETHQKFRMKINNKIYRQCPISTIDRFVVHNASEAYRLFELGVLPEDGGVGNQTTWAVQAASIYKSLLNRLEKDMIDNKKR